MILGLLHLAMAKEPVVTANQVGGVVEGSVGPILFLSGYIGFGLADYSDFPSRQYLAHSALMGAGLFMSVDGWVRWSAAGDYQKAADRNLDLLVAHRKMVRSIATADYILAGGCGALGLAGLLWSPALKAEAPGSPDSRYAATSGGVMFAEAGLMAAIGTITWFTPATGQMVRYHPDIRLSPTHVEFQWSW